MPEDDPISLQTRYFFAICPKDLSAWHSMCVVMERSSSSTLRRPHVPHPPRLTLRCRIFYSPRATCFTNTRPRPRALEERWAHAAHTFKLRTSWASTMAFRAFHAHASVRACNPRCARYTEISQFATAPRAAARTLGPCWHPVCCHHQRRHLHGPHPISMAGISKAGKAHASTHHQTRHLNQRPCNQGST